MDRIFLKDLRVPAIIGIWEWERRIRQTVSLDIEMAADARRAARTDTITDTVHYKAIAQRVIALVEGSEFQLVESLAEAVAHAIVVEHDVAWVRVAVAKPRAIEGAREVGIVIERTSADYG
jgi:7,8-dihydroneopterin aldolase/epimerase/oxygenase